MVGKVGRMLSSMAGGAVSLAAGDLVRLAPEIHAAWLAAEIIAEPSKAEIAAGEVIDYKPEVRFVRPAGADVELELPDGKRVTVDSWIESVCKNAKLTLADWNNLGSGAQRELIETPIREMRAKIAAAEARKAADKAGLVQA